LNYKSWIISELDLKAESVLSSGGIPKLAAKVLAARGVKTLEQARSFLRTDSGLIGDPMELADMEKACGRIRQALEKSERIAVFGDYDVDGITAVSLLLGWLREKGADCIYYIPDRIEEGYGMSTAAIDRLAEEGVSLIITVDLGITATEEAKHARTLGIDLIITDHHECREELPVACAVINPCRADSKYPLKNLSGVGVAFMLVLAYEGVENIEQILTDYSDLVAVGTVADVMPMVGANRALVSRGLQEINRGRRLGLNTLVRESVPEDAKVNAGMIGFSIAPRINAAGRMGCSSLAVELFMTGDQKTAQEIVEKLCELNRMRQKMENDTYEEAVSLCDRYISRAGGKRPGALVISDKNWHPGVIGIIASRLSERFACPVFLISLENGVGKGSARSFYGINIVNAMQKASYLFDTWGGHEFAAGFTIREENIPALRELLENIACELEPPHIHIDAVLENGMLDDKSISGLAVLEPYGACNPVPHFLIPHVEIREIIPLGWGNSLKLTIGKGDMNLSALYFGMNKDRLDMCEGDVGDAACRVETLEVKGKLSVRIVLLDLRLEPEAYKKYNCEMSLFRRFIEGEDVTREEAAALMPQKQEFIAVLRHIHRNSDDDGHMTAMIGSMCRKISREERIELSYAKFMICVHALAEKNRLQYKLKDETIEIKLMEKQPTDLNTSRTMMRLRETLESSN